MNTTLKTCFKCHQSKPISQFYRHKKMADGHLNKCKECTKADVSGHRHGKGRDKVLAYDRERAKTLKRIANNKRQIARWKELHPDRYAAHIALRNAVRAGRIIPLPCLVCGAKAEAHHPDYSDPLYPVWLCPAHHKQTHALWKKINKHTE